MAVREVIGRSPTPETRAEDIANSLQVDQELAAIRDALKTGAATDT